MINEYDAIVVGARCAGAPTAMLLAEQGHRVLVVDRASFPSDTLSTLVIHATGSAALRRWGLLDDVVATGCPPLDTYTFDFGPVVISGTPHPCDGSSTAYAPRRTVLDKILVDAAARAGAEVRERFSVDDLLLEDGAVVGLRGHDGSGRPVVERARVVIGADGWSSRVARVVRPEQYGDKPMLENAFYTFWSGLDVDSFTTTIRGDRAFAAIPTNDDLTLLLVGFPFRDAGAFKADVERSYLTALEREPQFADRVRRAHREARFAGGGVPNFFRKPYGPGWVLVGDAGYTRDPVTAQGISDAFRDAEGCAAALHEVFAGRRTFDDAMSDHHHARDQRVRPIFEFTTQLATLDPPPPEMLQLLAASQGNQAAMDAFVSVVAGTMSPVDYLAPDHVAGIFQTAAA
jgi:2-polyprenyl-6-methoxyphenol hydroxylase-like FAD-dependent oxidoreductase